MDSYTFIHLHMHPYIFIYVHILSYAFIYFHLHSYTIICFHTDSYGLIYIHTPSYTGVSLEGGYRRFTAAYSVMNRRLFCHEPSPILTVTSSYCGLKDWKISTDFGSWLCDILPSSQYPRRSCLFFISKYFFLQV